MLPRWQGVSGSQRPQTKRPRELGSAPLRAPTHRCFQCRPRACVTSAYRQGRLPPDRIYKQMFESPALGHKGRGPLSTWLVASCWPIGVFHQLLPQGCQTSPTCTNQLELGSGDSFGHRTLLGTPGRHLSQPHSLQKAGRLLDLAAITCSSGRLAKVGPNPQTVPKSQDLWATSYLLSSLTQASLFFEVLYLSRPPELCPRDAERGTR